MIFLQPICFNEKSDAFRTTYTTKSSNYKIGIEPNVLFIYHLGEDTFENQFSEKRNPLRFRRFDDKRKLPYLWISIKEIQMNFSTQLF
jgi:hypothetical protein